MDNTLTKSEIRISGWIRPEESDLHTMDTGVTNVLFFVNAWLGPTCQLEVYTKHLDKWASEILPGIGIDPEVGGETCIASWGGDSFFLEIVTPTIERLNELRRKLYATLATIEE